MAEQSSSSLLARPRLLGGFLALASASTLGAAFYFQHVEGLQPCPLCVAQRWAHTASLVLGLMALAAGSSRLAAWLLAATGLAFLAGACIAGYHVGVEQHWVESSFCDSPDMLADTVEELKALLWETEIALCDEIPWSLLGISMAGYNLIISLGLALVALAGARKTWKVSP